MTECFFLQYDPTACDWNETLEAFYAQNPGTRGKVFLVLKPKTNYKNVTKMVTKNDDNSKQKQMFND